MSSMAETNSGGEPKRQKVFGLNLLEIHPHDVILAFEIDTNFREGDPYDGHCPKCMQMVSGVLTACTVATVRSEEFFQVLRPQDYI